MKDNVFNNDKGIMNKALESKLLTAEIKLKHLKTQREKLELQISSLTKYIDSLKNDLEVEEEIER